MARLGKYFDFYWVKSLEYAWFLYCSELSKEEFDIHQGYCKEWKEEHGILPPDKPTYFIGYVSNRYSMPYWELKLAKTYAKYQPPKEPLKPWWEEYDFRFRELSDAQDKLEIIALTISMNDDLVPIEFE